MAEGEGFEPSVPQTGHTAFPAPRLRPLGHPSYQYINITTMRLILVGLGRMGKAIAKRLKTREWELWGYARTRETREKAKEELGINILESYEELKNWEDNKIVWIMVPHTAVDDVLKNLKPFLKSGDIVIDGGNSYYRDSQRRYEELKSLGVSFLDVGVSGGVLGEREGFSLMVGGDYESFKKAERLFKDLAYKNRGYAYLGKSGAGHFAKMVHNGIEYGIMEAIAEGFELLKNSEFSYDLKEIARVYTEGSVIRSFLVELLLKAFEEFGELEEVEGYVKDSGEGRWFVEEAVKRGVSTPVIAQALFERFESRQRDLFRNKILAVLRYEFGKHSFKRRG